MARRKKAPPAVHRDAIAQAAEGLFQERGIAATTVDDIARAAGYSKATLYVYFKNKEEIVSALALDSMKKLQGYITDALAAHTGTRERYDAICAALERYQEQYPFYFQIALQEIKTDMGNPGILSVEKDIFETGEQINRMLIGFIESGIAMGDFRSGTANLPTVFAFWAMLSGLVQMAASKEAYLQNGMGISRQEFLKHGFDTLYRSIAN